VTESRLRRARMPSDGGPPNTAKDSTMDIERINALGTQITDLSQRTADLRRYL
jgi:hypothetical protein